MICIISGTNRPDSRSLEVSKIYKKLLAENTNEEIEILDLKELPLNELNGSQYAENKPEGIVKAVELVTKADGVLIVCPEYNGSYPGALKYFIDHWNYPDTFEARPVAFTGLGGRFGGLRPVEHLQGVFGYRNAYMFPERVFLTNIWAILKDGKITDENTAGLMKSQAAGFVKFVKALKTENLDANSRLQNK